MTKEGIQNIDIFSSLSEVRLVFWMWLCLNILCISSEKPHTQTMQLGLL